MVKPVLIFIVSMLQKFYGLKYIGKGSILKPPFSIWNRKHLFIGSNTFIGQNSFFALSILDARPPKVLIGDNCTIGSDFFIASVDSVIIENNVLISNRVFISDHIHDYTDVSIPVREQALVRKGKVRIKSGAFIGINAVISPGVRIGKNSIVGASAVVTKSVPDYTVVVGNPAKVIKFYDQNQKKWCQVKKGSKESKN